MGRRRLLDGEMRGEAGARRRDGEGKKDEHGKMWMEVPGRWRRLPHKYATSSRFVGLDPLGRVVRPKQRLGTSVIHFVNSWTGMTQQHKFEDHPCILLNTMPCRLAANHGLRRRRRPWPPSHRRFSSRSSPSSHSSPGTSSLLLTVLLLRRPPHSSSRSSLATSSSLLLTVLSA